eukprot:NODE_14035_length_1132_cov_4.120398.p1 GENE.NODE_14035_length_1132_cov_4.120398~~NODE_14035_length_1132_cov_4.120398.p1  ORF type:complete len:303 (-),score=75.18 NODE_14035_length_1132_cov_4.120398:164-1072(-)
MAPAAPQLILAVAFGLIAASLHGCSLFGDPTPECAELRFPVRGRWNKGKVDRAFVGRLGEVTCPPGLTFVGPHLECSLVGKICPARSFAEITEEACYYEYEYVRPGTGFKEWPEGLEPELADPHANVDKYLAHLHFLRTLPKRPPKPTPAPTALKTVALPPPTEVVAVNEHTMEDERDGELEDWGTVVAEEAAREPPKRRRRKKKRRTKPHHLNITMPDIVLVSELHCLHPKAPETEAKFATSAPLTMGLLPSAWLMDSAVGASMLGAIALWNWRRRRASHRSIAVQRECASLEDGAAELLE